MKGSRKYPLLAMALLLAGCGTINRKELKSDFDTRVYPATRFDASVIVDMGFKGGVAVGFPEDYTVLHYIVWCPIAIVLGVADMPFSLVTDTICLPYDLWTRKESTANNTSDGIRQPAAGLPKPSR